MANLWLYGVDVLPYQLDFEINSANHFAVQQIYLSLVVCLHRCGLAWLVALAVFVFLNLTPLCIGQDNSDGNNDIALCTMYTVLISLVYSPVALILIILNAIISGKNLGRVMNSTDRN